MSTDAAEPAGLDELSQARLDEGRALLADLVTEKARQQDAIEAERQRRRHTSSYEDDTPTELAYYDWHETGWLSALSTEQRRCVMFALAENLAQGEYYFSGPSGWLSRMAELPLGLVVGDVRLLAAVSEPGEKRGVYEQFEYVLDLVEQLLAARAIGADSLADSVADQVTRWNVTAYHWHSNDYILRGDDEVRLEHLSRLAELRDRALELAGRPPAPPPLEGTISRDDAWGLAAIDWLGVIEDWPPGVAPLLDHCSLAKATRPGARWSKVCRQRLDAVADISALLEHLLDSSSARSQCRQGAIIDGPPDAQAPAEVTEQAAEIKAALSAARDRLDGLFSNYREWHVTDFTDGYVRHPLVGWLARRLVWTYTTQGGDILHGFPSATGTEITTPQGTRPAPADCLVRLTHPVLLSGTEVGQLRRLCRDLALSQPIRQLWRETYQLTAAEQRTALYSDRYAGHILRFSHGYGLARRRGWTGGFLSGAWDGGDTADARRDYPTAGLRASWALRDVDSVPGEVAVGLCLSERLSFSPLGDTDGAPVPLAAVPVDVFSEAMRDLDLVVSVATVANDPTWLADDHCHPGIDEYWKRIAQGGFAELRVHRREVLAEVLDGDAGSESYQLTSTELIVRGSLSTYRIDLATANVRMKPSGKWLSFDTKLSPQAAFNHDVLWLPAVDDDEILRRILIRAAILADDEHLASRKLLKQIRG